MRSFTVLKSEFTTRLDPESITKFKNPGKTLKDVSKKIISGKTNTSGTKYYFYRVQDITDWNIRCASQKTNTNNLKPNDILITTKGRVGSVAIVTTQKGSFNQNITQIRLKDPSIAPAIAWYLRYSEGRHYINKLTTNQLNPYLRVSDLKTISIPPNLPLQQAKDIFKKLTSITNRQEKLLAGIHQYIQDNHKNSSTIFYANQSTMLANNRLDPESLTGNVDGLELKSLKSIKIFLSKKTTLLQNAICINRIGGAQKAVIIPKGKKLSKNTNLILITWSDNRVFQEYALHYLNSDDGTKELKKIQQGSKQQRLNISYLKKFKIPLLSRDIQKNIVTIHKQIQGLETTKQQFLEKFKNISS